jgi:hypothetical protein
MSEIVPLFSQLQDTLTTVQVSSAAGSAGTSLGITTATTKVQLTNVSASTDIDYNVAGSGWKTLSPVGGGVVLPIDLSTTTVMVRKGGATAGNVPLNVTVFVAGAVQANAPSAGVGTTSGAGGATAPEFAGSYADLASLTAAQPPALHSGATAMVAGTKYYSTGTAWTTVLPFLGRSQYWRLPEGADPNNSADSTAAMQKWANAATAGDPCWLPDGTFKMADTLTFTGSNAIAVEGSGARRSIINLTAANKSVVRVALNAGSAQPTGHIKNITAKGPTANAVTGQAAWLLDATQGFMLERTDAINMDMGYDMINNCYNATLMAVSASRFFSCNVGINLRVGSQNGSDHTIIAPLLFTKLAAFHVAGSGGGYHVFGGQAGCGGDGTDNDNLGVVILGKDYTSGTVGGGGNFQWIGVSFEGFQRMWGVRYFADVSSEFEVDFNASATGANAALGLVKMTGAGNPIHSYRNCSIANGSTFKTALFNTDFAGNANQAVEEGAWRSGAHTVNGVAKAAMSFKGLYASTYAGDYTCNAYGFHRDDVAVLRLGKTWFRSGPIFGDGKLQYSTDQGVTWALV